VWGGLIEKERKEVIRLRKADKHDEAAQLIKKCREKARKQVGKSLASSSQPGQ